MAEKHKYYLYIYVLPPVWEYKLSLTHRFHSIKIYSLHKQQTAEVTHTATQTVTEPERRKRSGSRVFIREWVTHVLVMLRVRGVAAVAKLWGPGTTKDPRVGSWTKWRIILFHCYITLVSVLRSHGDDKAEMQTKDSVFVHFTSSLKTCRFYTSAQVMLYDNNVSSMATFHLYMLRTKDTLLFSSLFVFLMS